MSSKKNPTKKTMETKIVIQSPSNQNEIDRIVNERASIIKIIDEQYEMYVKSINK
jgi:hypothetical protein